MSSMTNGTPNTSQPSTVDEPENHQQSSDEDNENSISEAGEEMNATYVVPPLSLLNQPTQNNRHQKQK